MGDIGKGVATGQHTIALKKKILDEDFSLLEATVRVSFLQVQGTGTGMAIAYRVPAAVPGAVSLALVPEAAARLLPDDSIFRFTVASWLSSNIIIP
jgi:hypothetical protein